MVLKAMAGSFCLKYKNQTLKAGIMIIISVLNLLLKNDFFEVKEGIF